MTDDPTSEKSSEKEAASAETLIRYQGRDVGVFKKEKQPKSEDASEKEKSKKKKKDKKGKESKKEVRPDSASPLKNDIEEKPKDDIAAEENTTEIIIKDEVTPSQNEELVTKIGEELFEAPVRTRN